MNSFKNSDGAAIVFDMIKTIQAEKQYLSEIDGAIGDGDHGINMNKGFSLCEKELLELPGDLAHSLQVLSLVLMDDIGGSMGPLYGMFFKAMTNICEGNEIIDRKIFGRMLKAGENGIRMISNAEIGDKTLLDCLSPAVKAFNLSIEKGKNFSEALDDMKKSSIEGRDSTKNMIAKVGRASRLGERSIGALDAGAASCCLLLLSMADTIQSLLKGNADKI